VVEVVGEVLSHGQRLPVGVVQVLQDDQAAALAAEPGQQPEHRLGEDHERVVGGSRRLVGARFDRLTGPSFDVRHGGVPFCRHTPSGVPAKTHGPTTRRHP